MTNEKHNYAVWIEAECWAPGTRTPDNENTDVIVTREDGSRWGATFISYQHVQTLTEKNKRTGENLSGAYFWVRGMILVDEVSRQRIEEVVHDLISEGDFEIIFRQYPKEEVAPATEEQLRASEQALGFPLPPLLRTLYAQVANGGFGADHGIKGAMGGFAGDLGTIVEMYLEGMEEVRQGRAQVINLAAYEPLAYDIDVSTIGYPVVLNKVIELPERALSESLLGFYSHGCGIFSHIDLGTGRIFLESHPYLYYEAHSLEEWLERWLNDAAQLR